MRFHDAVEGRYRIYAGAVGSPDGHGFVATLIIKRTSGSSVAEVEVFRDDALTDGMRWCTEEEAVEGALQFGRDIVRREPQRLRRRQP